MVFRIARLAPATALVLVAAGAASAAPGPGTPVRLGLVATGLPGAVFAAPAPSRLAGRLYVVQRSGVIRIVDRGRVLDPPFLNLRGHVATGGLRGLYSLAFDPRYRLNGRFFVNYVGRDGDVYVSGFTAATRSRAASSTAARACEAFAADTSTGTSAAVCGAWPLAGQGFRGQSRSPRRPARVLRRGGGGRALSDHPGGADLRGCRLVRSEVS
jgi:hypothetical protein